MSSHSPCTCNGSRRERMKFWYVSQRHYNLSYFEKPKGCEHISDYSTVRCSRCSMCFRSKASFVDYLPDNPPAESGIIDGMEQFTTGK